jgi:hypothetical protein
MRSLTNTGILFSEKDFAPKMLVELPAIRSPCVSNFKDFVISFRVEVDIKIFGIFIKVQN